MSKLNADALKSELWDSLMGLKQGNLDAATGNAVASQAREILRTIRTQLIILDKSHAEVTKELKDFAG